MGMYSLLFFHKDFSDVSQLRDVVVQVGLLVNDSAKDICGKAEDGIHKLYKILLHQRGEEDTYGQEIPHPDTDPSWRT